MVTYGTLSSWRPSVIRAEVIIFVIAFILFSSSEYAGILRMREMKGKLKRIVALIALISILSGALLYEPIRYDQVVFVGVGREHRPISGLRERKVSLKQISLTWDITDRRLLLQRSF